jgi:ABC-type uncharacterized transport system involved in gliding motility auxiliary subunit
MQKKFLETILYSVAGVVGMAAVLIAFNVVTGAFHKRADLTREKAFTLTDGTRAILAKLDTPLKIRFYCSRLETTTPYSVPLKSYSKKVEDLLEEYQQAARGKLIIEKYDPQPDSDAEDSARLDGIEEQPMPAGEKFYLGLAVSMVDTKEAIPFLSPDRERQLEYDISRAISRVVSPEKPVIGVMSSLPVFGMPSNPMMMQMGQRGQEPWALIGELRNDFTLKNIPMESDSIPDDVKVLLVIHPKNISDQAQYAIDQFILRGGKMIAFLDAQSLVDSRGQNPMMGMQMGGGSSLDKLLQAWGIQYDTSKVVADINFKMQLGDERGETQRPVWLALTPEGINANDIATGELDNIWYFSGGAFTGTPGPEIKETVLLKTTRDSQLVDGMMANFDGENILKDFKSSGTEYALAIRLTGKFKTAFPEGKPKEKANEENSAEPKAETTPADHSLKVSKEETAVILIGDADLINDGFTLRRMNSPFGTVLMPMNANLNFAQNAIEQLAGDNHLIGVRSRTVLNRPFTRIKAIEAQADAKHLAKRKELQESADETMKRLSELQQHKSENQKYILSPEQEAEIANLRKKEIEISQQRRKVEKDRRREVNALQQKIQWSNILTVPVIVCLSGMALAVYKRKRNSAK